ncbi:MAG: hypothetical protein U1D30_11830 [Planctomycetota bacterium]
MGANRTTGITYNADLFEAETIRRMGRHYLNLLRGMLEEPETTVGELEILESAERHALIVEWNETATPYPREKSIHEVFEHQAKRTP